MKVSNGLKALGSATLFIPTLAGTSAAMCAISHGGQVDAFVAACFALTALWSGTALCKSLPRYLTAQKHEVCAEADAGARAAL